MKRILVSVLFCFMFVSSTAQDTAVFQKRSMIGVHYKAIDAIPYELSFTRVAKPVGYNLKGGYGAFRSGDEDDYTPVGMSLGDSHVSLNKGFTAFSRTEAIYLRGGVVIPYGKGVKWTKYLALNANYSYAFHRLYLKERTSYGLDVYTTTTSYREERSYLSAELELAWMRKLGSRFLLGFSLLEGVKIRNQGPFENIVENFGKASSYTAGEGLGRYVYFNLTVGLYFVASAK